MGLKIKIVSGYNHDYDFNLKFIEKTYKPILGDSFNLYKYLINGIGMNYFYAEEIYNFLSISKEPVSYTHLTLPTNVSMCRSRWSPYH